MVLLGLRLRDVPNTIGWDGLTVFVRNLPMTSAYVRAMFPEEIAFAADLKRAAMMADLIDALNLLRYEFAVSMSGKGQKPDMPQRYPTPWNKHATPEDPLNGTYGKGAISSVDFYDWYYGTNTKEIDDGN